MSESNVEEREFTFDPFKSSNPEIRAVFQDDIAQIIWVGIKWKHLVDQYFNQNCIGLAKTLRLKKWANITGAELNSMLMSRRMIGSQEEDVGDNLLPYIKGERKFKYVIKEEGEGMKEDIATIIAKLPDGSVGLTDPVYHQRRMELARPKAGEILTRFLSWLEYNAPEYVWQKFKDEEMKK